MGHAARANPRSFESAQNPKAVMEARLRRFCDYFRNRADFESYLDKAHVGDAQRAYLETLLPDRLRGN